MKVTASVSIFHVRDITAAMKFYQEVLGFELEFIHENAYASLKVGDVFLHLTSMSSSRGATGKGTVYFTCDEVDSYYAEIKAKGADVQGEPTDQFYGLRDFIVADPDGNHLSFGCNIAAK